MPRFVGTEWPPSVKADVLALVDPEKLMQPERFGLSESFIHHVIDSILARMRPSIDPEACFTDANICMDETVFREGKIGRSKSGHLRLPGFDRVGKLSLHKSVWRVFCPPHSEPGKEEVLRHKHQTRGKDGSLRTCKCGNPAHLRLGSKGENNRDKSVENVVGRSFGSRNGHTNTEKLKP